ncbi:hypothetical protein BS47DRAFT_1336496 [Hydnum rufescens UP504]|uniref:Histone H1 n=1 Tax=Hydnum rufescens UP504 TaxID=1448309 RepID=A0A9P6B978_9AGAM|nr:hypothetical protein BS47DRAFT_1336496 [Hydnum rufescens UP504]
MPRTPVAPAARPPFIDMIKEAIIDSKERTGISRSTIKKYLEAQYKIDVNNHVIASISRAIKTGAGNGVFTLPKGPSGKVKLAPKAPRGSTESTKENVNPTPKAVAKKSVSVKGKKPLGSGTAAKSKPTTSKKTAAAPAKKPPPNLRRRSKSHLPNLLWGRKRLQTKSALSKSPKKMAAIKSPKSKSAPTSKKSAAPASKKKSPKKET